MVHIETLNKLRRRIEENLETYEKERPGEFVLAEMSDGVIRETFHKNKNKLEKALKEVKGYCCFEKIPTHRFNEGNETFLSLDKYIKVCPNDNKTRLVFDAIHSYGDGKGNTIYKEHTYCPDCECLVFRRPLEKTIKELEEGSGKVTFSLKISERTNFC